MAEDKPVDAYAREVSMRVTNEQTLQIADKLLMGYVDGYYSVRIHCECATPQCSELVEIARDELHRHRSHPATFIVQPDHVRPDIEDIIYEHENYVAVRKPDTQVVTKLEKVMTEQPMVSTKYLEDLGSTPDFISYFNRLARNVGKSPSQQQ